MKKSLPCMILIHLVHNKCMILIHLVHNKQPGRNCFSPQACLLWPASLLGSSEYAF